MVMKGISENSKLTFHTKTSLKQYLFPCSTYTPYYSIIQENVGHRILVNFLTIIIILFQCLGMIYVNVLEKFSVMVSLY